MFLFYDRETDLGTLGTLARVRELGGGSADTQAPALTKLSISLLSSQIETVQNLHTTIMGLVYGLQQETLLLHTLFFLIYRRGVFLPSLCLYTMCNIESTTYPL